MVITEKVEVLAEIRLEEQQKGTGLALDVPIKYQGAGCLK